MSHTLISTLTPAAVGGGESPQSRVTAVHSTALEVHDPASEELRVKRREPRVAWQGSQVSQHGRSTHLCFLFNVQFLPFPRSQGRLMGLGCLLEQVIKVILRTRHVCGNTDKEGGARLWN